MVEDTPVPNPYKCPSKERVREEVDDLETSFNDERQQMLSNSQDLESVIQRYHTHTERTMTASKSVSFMDTEQVKSLGIDQNKSH